MYGFTLCEPVETTFSQTSSLFPFSVFCLFPHRQSAKSVEEVAEIINSEAAAFVLISTAGARVNRYERVTSWMGGCGPLIWADLIFTGLGHCRGYCPVLGWSGVGGTERVQTVRRFKDGWEVPGWQAGCRARWVAGSDGQLAVCLCCLLHESTSPVINILANPFATVFFIERERSRGDGRGMGWGWGRSE